MQTITVPTGTSDVPGPDALFNSHLDACERCFDQPFNLCPLGTKLMRAATSNTKEADTTVDLAAAVHPATGEEYLFQPDDEKGLLLTKKTEPQSWFSMFDLDLEDGLRLTADLLSVLAPVSPYGRVLRAIHAMLTRDYYRPALITDLPTPDGVSYHNFGVQ